GPLFVCRGGTAQYYVEPMPGVQSYTWSLPASWQGSSNTDSITIIAGGNTDTIRVAAQFFCGTGPEKSLVVSVSPEPIISVPAGTALCAGDSIELFANVAPGMSWDWMHNGNL